MKNDPLLFIDSITDKKDKDNNQEVFDSRYANKRALYKHRIDDIRAMLFYRINVIAEITTKTEIIEGLVIEVKDEGLIMKKDGKKIVIPIDSIQDINIIKV